MKWCLIIKILDEDKAVDLVKTRMAMWIKIKFNTNDNSKEISKDVWRVLEESEYERQWFKITERYERIWECF